MPAETSCHHPRIPRQARIDSPGALQHVICRGIERRKIFLSNADKDDFVERLEKLLALTETRCFAWALLDNHFHLLLQTGPTPLSTFMRRLLTGYAVSFNRRRKRSGHLFQNRYKSILCQQDAYLLELIRYIHLNPLRADLVASFDDLAGYRYCGHRQLLGLIGEGPVSTADALRHFGQSVSAARKKYHTFMADGVEQGQRPELGGGGSIRSLIGPGPGVKDGELQQGDSRILGDDDFVARVLAQAELQLDAKARYRVAGFGLPELATVVARLLEVDVAEVRASGKQPQRVRARSLYCYWSVRELGFNQPAVSMAVQRGERLAQECGWKLPELINL